MEKSGIAHLLIKATKVLIYSVCLKSRFLESVLIHFVVLTSLKWHESYRSCAFAKIYLYKDSECIILSYFSKLLRKPHRNSGLNYFTIIYMSLIIHVREYLSCRIRISQMTCGRIEKDIPLVEKKEESGVMKDVEKKERLWMGSG